MLIGKSIEITDSKNKNDVGIKGHIIDETKNMIIIKNQKIHKLFKKNIKYKIVNEGK